MPATKKKKRPLYLCEEFGPALPAATAEPARDMKRVEEMLAQGIVENVKVQGLISANNRVYLIEGLDENTYTRTPLGTSMPCNLNHPQFDANNQAEVKRAITRSRPVEHVFGGFEGLYKTATGMFAKAFRFNRKHKFAPTFEEWVRTAPDKIGFSPAQFVDSYHDGEKEVVEKVVGVYSIDLVGQGATTRGLLEAMGYGDDGAGADADDEKEKNAVVEDDDPDAAGGIGGAMEDELGDPDADPEQDEEDDDAGDAGGAGGPDITPEMLTAITKVVQSRLDGECDDKAAIKKIKALFSTHSAVSEAVMGQIETNPAAYLRRHNDPAVRMAGKSLIAERDTLASEKARADKRTKVTALVEARNFDPVQVAELGLIDELMECSDEPAMGRRLAFFSRLPGMTRRGGRPKSAGQQGAGDSRGAIESADAPAVPTEEEQDAALARMANAVVGAAELN